MMGLAGRERSLTISLPVWMHNTNMTHGQTAMVVPHIHIALCGKTRQIHYRLKVRLMQSFKRCVVHSCFGCREHGGRDRGGGPGGHGPSNNLVGGAIMYLAPPQYFALEFKILTLGLMQREENMFRVPLCWMCVHCVCKIHYTY